MNELSEINVEGVSLEFKLYQDKHTSIKEKFALMLRGQHSPQPKQFWALKDVSLNIVHGERVGIVGHNGAGKSTLLKTICRIYEPTFGTVRVAGKVAPLLEIGAGFQPEISGRENIYLNGAILGYTRPQLEKIEREVIEFTGMQDFIDTPVKYYSTGMYMKLAFAIATAVHPEILILDELFAGGDAEFIARAQERMASFVDNSSILVFVSHQTDLIRRLCNRVIWMDHGQIREDGPTEQVLTNYLHKGE
ncbi:ATP-binding cassette domain-containing protein [Xylophilus rhododendri]|uniref:ATP-binding cassette domain-containing protein n=1 Tax=Xylophilus rhododendri TaxID=2697032 RepID=A0A857J4F5_9BURK|nr:ABC transporter ATP-binding protein [Xylophilus rhododendri]QHI97922.1 ATP-binding cassette domain-containing protein [Xylophilus rhododendri]